MKRHFDLSKRRTCPYCKSRSFEMRESETSIPYFGKVLVTTFLCQACGYRHSDVLSLEDHGPKKYVVNVSGADDLRIMIARSGAASIEIPELGLRLNPGDDSQSFITNIEGILLRFEEAIEKLKTMDPAKSPEADERLRAIKLAKAGGTSFTVIVEDPLGNTTVIENYNVT
jgi:zinc finger protein